MAHDRPVRVNRSDQSSSYTQTDRVARRRWQLRSVGLFFCPFLHPCWLKIHGGSIFCLFFVGHYYYQYYVSGGHKLHSSTPSSSEGAAHNPTPRPTGLPGGGGEQNKAIKIKTAVHPWWLKIHDGSISAYFYIYGG